MRSNARSVVATLLGAIVLGGTVGTGDVQGQADLRVEDHYADNDGVRIHYVSAGPADAPLVVFIHGFPDFWYSWRHQMEALQDRFHVVAMDQRGYNLSGQPEGVAAYAMPNLIGDVAAVIRANGRQSATIVGHDWGGAVAWQFAFALPQMVDRLVILNLPHPNGMGRELASNPEQRAGSGYAQKFIEGSPSDPDIFFGNPMTAQTLSGWVTDAAARPRYVEAFQRSSFEGMLNFYKANYPRLPPEGAAPPAAAAAPTLHMPVLQFHGLKDTALNSDGLNNTWDWIDADYTLVTAPESGHFVQQDASELVSSTLRSWLLARQ
jgi:pimeloyl-ACP methyl ester carboxylesterase